MKSGGNVKLPVGDVQLRIDDNKYWEITTLETPIINSIAPNYKLLNFENLDSKTKKLVDETMQNTMESVTKTMSPFTATSGSKALNIIEEMKKGKKLKYRTIGANQAASTTGEYMINESFYVALKECGIET